MPVITLLRCAISAIRMRLLLMPPLLRLMIFAADAISPRRLRFCYAATFTPCAATFCHTPLLLRRMPLLRFAMPLKMLPLRYLLVVNDADTRCCLAMLDYAAILRHAAMLPPRHVAEFAATLRATLRLFATPLLPR